MNVLITGGAGFIGANLVHYWLKHFPEDTVVNFDALTYAGHLENLTDIAHEPRYQFVHGNLLDIDAIKSTLKKYQIDGVMHLAAESHVDRSISGPGHFIQTNVIGTFNLLESLREFWSKASYPTRFLHVSTDEVYGSLGETGLFSESTAYAPNSPYSASKASSDHLVRAYHHTYGINTVTTNCSNNYGPFQYPEKLIPLLIKNCLAEQPLPVYGNGANIRDWLYVEDHCRAIDQVFHHGESGETYNVGGLNEWKNIDIVHEVCDFFDVFHSRTAANSYRNLITFVEDRLGHDQRYAIDASKLQKELGWAPQVDFQEGLQRTIRWYLDHQNWIGQVLDKQH